MVNISRTIKFQKSHTQPIYKLVNVLDVSTQDIALSLNISGYSAHGYLSAVFIWR